eukprot:653290-Rhodomonas_salina.1
MAAAIWKGDSDPDELIEVCRAIILRRALELGLESLADKRKHKASSDYVETKKVYKAATAAGSELFKDLPHVIEPRTVFTRLKYKELNGRTRGHNLSQMWNSLSQEEQARYATESATKETEPALAEKNMTAEEYKARAQRGSLRRTKRRGRGDGAQACRAQNSARGSGDAAVWLLRRDQPRDGADRRPRAAAGPRPVNCASRKLVPVLTLGCVVSLECSVVLEKAAQLV